MCVRGSEKCVLDEKRYERHGELPRAKPREMSVYSSAAERT